MNPELVSIIEQCIHLNASDRSSIETLLKSKVFNEIRVPHHEIGAVAKEKVSLKLDMMKDGDIKEYSSKSLMKYIVKYCKKIQLKTVPEGKNKK